MAKVSLSRITPIKSIEDKIIEINGAEIIVKQFLPFNTIINFIQEYINYVFDNDGFISPARKELYWNLLLIKYFTNINLTESMFVNADKTYDSLYLNNIFDNIIVAINEKFLKLLKKVVFETEQKVQEYNTSFVGWIKSSADDKALAEMDLNKLLEQIKNNENFDTVKQVIEKLG